MYQINTLCGVLYSIKLTHEREKSWASINHQYNMIEKARVMYTFHYGAFQFESGLEAIMANNKGNNNNTISIN